MMPLLITLLTVNKIGDAGATQLADVLQRNSTLTALSILGKHDMSVVVCLFFCIIIYIYDTYCFLFINLFFFHHKVIFSFVYFLIFVYVFILLLLSLFFLSNFTYFCDAFFVFSFISIIIVVIIPERYFPLYQR